MKIVITDKFSMNTAKLIEDGGIAAIPNAQAIIEDCLQRSAEIWCGSVDDQVVCVFGLIAPSLLSTTAWMWLITTKVITQHKFLFVRYSRRWVEDALKRYPRLIGDVVCGEGADSTQRWLGLLGAKFLSPINNRIPFEIRADNG